MYKNIIFGAVLLFSLTQVVTAGNVPANHWVTRSSTDPMTDARTLEAVLGSDDEWGRSRIALQGNSKTGLAIRFQSEHGPILCPSRCSVLVRFDSAPPLSIRAGSSSEGNPNTIELYDHPVMLANLRRSKTVLVEITYVGEGKRVSRFDTSGFVWPTNGAPLPHQRRGKIYKCIDADFTRGYTDIVLAGSTCSPLDLPGVR